MALILPDFEKIDETMAAMLQENLKFLTPINIKPSQIFSPFNLRHHL